ncbi:MAG: general secretion pathway protein K, partial [Flavobacteriales bacterium]
MSYRSLRSLCAKQSGVAGIALLTALMVVALVTTIAVKESWRSSLDLARFSHRWLGLQSKAYIEGAEALALMVIDEDTKSSGTVDSLDEDWAQVYEFPTDHGGLRLQLSDAQGRVNLNGLGKAFVRTGTGVGATIKPGFDKHQPEQKRFIRLLRAINLATEVDDELYIDQHDAEVILEAVKDWIDADNTVEDFNGAEADYYNQLEPPLTINNGPMASVSELLRIKGMTPILYQRLLPHIVALDISVGLNINTAN